MNTSLHAAVNLVFGKVYFVIVVSNFCGVKMRLFASIQNSKSKKSIFGQFEIIFINI